MIITLLKMKSENLLKNLISDINHETFFDEEICNSEDVYALQVLIDQLVL